MQDPVGLAVALAFLLDDLDDRLRTPADITTIMDSPPLASIGRINAREMPEPERAGRLVALHAQRSPPAEAFRTLRTNLRFATLDRSVRSLVQ